VVATVQATIPAAMAQANGSRRYSLALTTSRMAAYAREAKR
jgi:hypothetical protein